MFWMLEKSLRPFNGFTSIWHLSHNDFFGGENETFNRYTYALDIRFKRKLRKGLPSWTNEGSVNYALLSESYFYGKYM